MEPEDLGVVIPHAEDRSSSQRKRQFVEVTAGKDDGIKYRYDETVYLALVRGRYKGRADSDIMVEAQRLTDEIEKNKLDYDEAIRQASKSNGAVSPALHVPAPTSALPPVPRVEAIPVETEIVQRTPKPVDDMNPKVKVQFKGWFGTFRTRYHEVEESDQFLALIFDNGCETYDMYEPPVTDKVIEVSVSMGSGKPDVYYVISIGIGVDLHKRNIHVIMLPRLPEDHKKVRQFITGEQDTSEDDGGMGGGMDDGMSEQPIGPFAGV